MKDSIEDYTKSETDLPESDDGITPIEDQIELEKAQPSDQTSKRRFAFIRNPREDDPPAKPEIRRSFRMRTPKTIMSMLTESNDKKKVTFIAKDPDIISHDILVNPKNENLPKSGVIASTIKQLIGKRPLVIMVNDNTENQIITLPIPADIPETELKPQPVKYLPEMDLSRPRNCLEALQLKAANQWYQATKEETIFRYTKLGGESSS
jgi:hypothetical protein